jgi:hypothetical protein
MADEEIPDGGVEELCDFWKWALAKKRELEERVAELSDHEQPRRDSIEQDIVAMAKSDGESTEAIEEKRKEFRKFWRTHNERDLRTAERDLQRFLYGPVAQSHSGRPVFKRGLSGMVSSAPRFTFRQAWENRTEKVLIAGVVDALCGYFGASEDSRPAGTTWQRVVRAVGLSEREKKWYEARTSLMVLILEEQPKPWNLEMQRAAGQEAEALVTGMEGSRPLVEEGAPRWNEAKLKVFDLVAERTGRTRASVIKVYQDFRR